MSLCLTCILLLSIAVPHVSYACFVDAECKIAKYHEETPNTLRVYMLNLRLKEVTTDMLITFYIPRAFAEGGACEGKPIVGHGNEVIERAIKSFTICNMGIFGK